MTRPPRESWATSKYAIAPREDVGTGADSSFYIYPQGGAAARLGHPRTTRRLAIGHRAPSIVAYRSTTSLPPQAFSAKVGIIHYCTLPLRT